MLQWGQAEVSDGTLTVPVQGERPEGWEDKFAQTVTLLGRNRWGEVACEDGSVRVDGVAEGSEESLRHFLESAVQEANAAFDLRPDREDDDGTDDEQRRSDDDGDADAQMTDRFREFGEPTQPQ